MNKTMHPPYNHACPPNNHAHPHCGQNCWHMLLKILPCPNFIAGGNNLFYRQKIIATRKHSSRMRTAHLKTISCFSFSNQNLISLQGVPKWTSLNRSPVITTSQMSLLRASPGLMSLLLVGGGGSTGLMSRGWEPGLMLGIHYLTFSGEGTPYHVTYPMMNWMLPTPHPEQTDACENITFPQTYLRVVTMV